MKKILVPIDGSEASKKAAEQALAIARELKSSVTFLTVVNVDSDFAYDLGTMINMDFNNLSDNLITLKKERDSSMLDAIVQTLDLTGVNTEKTVVTGNAHPKIVEIAEHGKFDLIVMGHRGLNPLSRIFIGSVAKRVIEDAPCSVLIAK